MGTGSIDITPSTGVVTNYITYATIQDRVPNLSELTAVPPTGQTAQQYIESLIADSEAEIDSYLRSSYTVPVSPVTDELVMVAVKLVRHALLRDNYHQESAEINAWVQSFRDEAIGTLKAMALHKQTIDSTAGSVNTIGCSTISTDRIFTRDTTVGW